MDGISLTNEPHIKTSLNFSAFIYLIRYLTLFFHYQPQTQILLLEILTRRFSSHVSYYASKI